MAPPSSKETEKERSRRKLALQKKYTQRITIARQGRDAFLQKDYKVVLQMWNLSTGY